MKTKILPIKRPAPRSDSVLALPGAASVVHPARRRLFEEAGNNRCDAWHEDHDIVQSTMAQLRRVTNIRVDAGETALFLRQLTQIATKTYDKVFADLLARVILPVSHEINTGADHFAQQGYEPAGEARIISDYASDLPGLSLKGGEMITPVRGIGQSYSYSIQEVRAAAFAGKPLEAKKAFFARRFIENKIERIAALGDDKFGLGGLLNNGDVDIITPPDFTGAWDTLTDVAGGDSLTILADMNYIAGQVWLNSGTTFRADTALLPPSRYSQISTQQMSQYDSRTILQAFLEAQKAIVDGEGRAIGIGSVLPWLFLETADSMGTGPRAMVYYRNPAVVELQMAQEFEQFPPQPVNLAFEIACHARCAGVTMPYPKSALYADGI